MTDSPAGRRFRAAIAVTIAAATVVGALVLSTLRLPKIAGAASLPTSATAAASWDHTRAQVMAFINAYDRHDLAAANALNPH